MKTFIKDNNTPYENSLIKEYEGLELLSKYIKDNEYLNIPKVIDINSNKLVLEAINSRSPTKKLSSDLGIGLGQLHKIKFEKYGLKSDNYIGLNPQKNILTNTWGDFL